MGREQSSDKAFVMPEWAASGPLTLLNYDWRAANHCIKQRPERGGSHPTLTLNVSDDRFRAWFEFFLLHLGGFPWVFHALCTKQIGEMTLPEAWPQYFDSRFHPTPNYPVKFATVKPIERWEPHAERPNVFVPVYAPQYRDMLEAAQHAKPEEYRFDVTTAGKDWRNDEARRGGIHVPLAWLGKPRVFGAFERGGYLHGCPEKEIRIGKPAIELDRNWKNSEVEF